MAAPRHLAAGLALTVALLAGGAGPAHASHRDRCRYEEDCGDRYGDGDSSNGNTGYDGEGGRSGDTDQRGDHNCRNFCFYGLPAPGGDQPPKDQQPRSLACAIPVPFHCDPKPASLTDPRKLPQVIAQIAKAGLDMGQLFATTTIKFVEELFTALA